MKQKIVRYCLVLFSLTSSFTSAAQTGPGVFIGIDNYQLAHVGFQYQISRISSFELFLGTNFHINKNKEWSTGLSFNQLYIKPIVGKLNPGYSIGTVYWVHEDELYRFENISFPLKVLLSYPLSNQLTIRGEAGAIYTYVITSDRKQNEEAGFPNRANFNFGFKLIYKFRKDEK
jgi:hypothetical protein